MPDLFCWRGPIANRDQLSGYGLMTITLLRDLVSVAGLL